MKGSSLFKSNANFSFYNLFELLKLMNYSVGLCVSTGDCRNTIYLTETFWFVQGFARSIYYIRRQNESFCFSEDGIEK